MNQEPLFGDIFNDLSAAGEIGKSVFIEPLDVTSAHDAIDLARKHKVTGIVHLAVPALNALSAARLSSKRNGMVKHPRSRPIVWRAWQAP